MARVLKLRIPTLLLLAVLAAAMILLNTRTRTVRETLKINEYHLGATSSVRGWPFPYRTNMQFEGSAPPQPVRVAALLGDIAVGLGVLALVGYGMERVLLRKAE